MSSRKDSRLAGRKRARSKQRKSAGSSDENELALEPEVEDFVRWFSDWWLRRGRDLVRERKAREKGDESGQ